MNQFAASIVSNNEVIPGIYLTRLELPQLMSAQPGQFVMVRCGEDTLLRRPLSIHQLTTEDGRAELALLFNVVGKGTHWLSQRRMGEKLDLLGPLGNGYTIYPTSYNLLLAAGGIGIAPLCFLAQRVLARGCSVRLLLGASTACQLYPRHLLPPEAGVFTSTEDGSAGEKGRGTDLLLKFADWADQIFACGPNPMYQTMATQNLKIKYTQISLEMRMGCGFGTCLGCTIKTITGLKQVCKDGPIFNLGEIFWDEIDLLRT